MTDDPGLGDDVAPEPPAGAQTPGPPSDVPDDVADRIAALDERSLREVADYARTLLEARRPDRVQIEVGPGEELVRLEEREEYLVVVKRQPCGEGCEGCPHGPYLYHVYPETHPDGRESPHWVFVGPVRE